MRIGFHSSQLGLRGTEIAMYDYAKYNRELLGNESVIIYPTESANNDIDVKIKFTKQFSLYGYHDFQDINNICDMVNLDAVYFIKEGNNDGQLSNRKNLIHAVFQMYQPHGDRYAYVSRWLSEHMTNIVKQPTLYVPHMVILPEPTSDFRNLWNIPKDALVIGRYGGYNEFDLDYVKEAVIEYVNTNTNCYFVFVNTLNFVNHPRVLFLPSIVNLQEKSNFINTCDAMIHARKIGETFGLAICEFLYGNKPVFAFNGGKDRHHCVVLDDVNLLYNNKSDLLMKFDMLATGYYSNKPWRDLVIGFSPEQVMKQFNKVFLEELI